jgi:FeS assembly SUF system protein
MQAFASPEMVKNALGSDYDEMAEPPCVKFEGDMSKLNDILKGLRAVYDPEIPVNIYELGLIYKIHMTHNTDTNEIDVAVDMSLTSPGCPVAQEMPLMVQGAIFPIEGIGTVDVEIVWDPPWDAGMMAETAKLQLNMFT